YCTYLDVLFQFRPITKQHGDVDPPYQLIIPLGQSPHIQEGRRLNGIPHGVPCIPTYQNGSIPIPLFLPIVWQLRFYRHLWGLRINTIQSVFQDHVNPHGIILRHQITHQSPNFDQRPMFSNHVTNWIKLPCHLWSWFWAEYGQFWQQSFRFLLYQYFFYVCFRAITFAMPLPRQSRQWLYRAICDRQYNVPIIQRRRGSLRMNKSHGDVLRNTILIL